MQQIPIFISPPTDHWKITIGLEINDDGLVSIYKTKFFNYDATIHHAKYQITINELISKLQDIDLMTKSIIDIIVSAIEISKNSPPDRTSEAIAKHFIPSIQNIDTYTKGADGEIYVKLNDIKKIFEGVK